MRILVNGANGQLGKDLIRVFGVKHDVIGLGRNDWDITNLAQCRSVIQTHQPDVVIHSAAFTAVDLAESEETEAYQVNAFGSRNVAIAAQEMGTKVCYISTDYVFDGNGSSPYKEYDNTNPTGVYGKSKRAGEIFVQSFSQKHFIVRTSWVYGLHGNNFVKTMLNLAKSKDYLKVVHDQVGSPTYTVDLSRFVEQLVQTEKYGIYHASNTGHCSWYEFAKSIFEESVIDIQVDPCSTDEFPRPAPRPKYSVMDHLSLRANGFEDLRPWREALQDFLKELKSNENR